MTSLAQTEGTVTAALAPFSRWQMPDNSEIS